MKQSLTREVLITKKRQVDETASNTSGVVYLEKAGSGSSF